MAYGTGGVNPCRDRPRETLKVARARVCNREMRILCGTILAAECHLEIVHGIRESHFGNVQ